MKGYWIICVNTYTYDDKEIPKGRMNYHTSIRAVVSNNWRRATEKEINEKQWHKGNFYFLDKF